MNKTEEESWLPVVGYEGLYEISNMNQVKRLFHIVTNPLIPNWQRIDEEKILSLQIDNKGYYQIRLQKDGIRNTFKLHRLVALAFIPNPNNLPCINHLNGIKADCRPENLEWCTYRENTLHMYRTGLKTNIPYPSALLQHQRENQTKYQCLCTGRIYSFSEAIKFLQINSGHFSRMMTGKRPNWTNFIVYG